MNWKQKLLALTTILAIVGTPAFASSSRILDAQQITNGAATLTLPTTTTTLDGTDTTVTLTNKSMSGAANTFTLIPVGAIGNGSVLSGSNTGDVTQGAFGSTPNAFGFSLSGQALSLQPADATHPGALSTADWNTFNGKQAAGNYITALTGDVTASGPGSAAATLATVNSNVGSFTNANITVNAKGLVTAASNGTGTAPTVSGSRASPTAITAGGGISFSASTYQNISFIQGSGGAVTVTANPQVAAGSSVGQTLSLIGRSATNTVTLADGTGLSLNGAWVGGLDSILNLVWDGTNWAETSRR